MLAGLAALGVALLLLLRRQWKQYRYRVWFGLLGHATFFCLGFTLCGLHIERVESQPIYGSEVQWYVAVVDDFPQMKPRSVLVPITIVGGWVDSLHVMPMRWKAMAYVAQGAGAEALVPGSLISFAERPAPIVPPVVPGQFDYRAYLLRKGVPSTVHIKGLVTLQQAKIPVGIIHRLRHWREVAIGQFARAGMMQRELGVVAALVLGKRELVDPELRTAYSDAGAVHILAVSGLHVGIIYLFAALVFGKLLPGNRWRFARLMITLLVLWFYAGITGFSPSVLRAATMFSFIALGRESGRVANIYNMMAASALTLLVFNPFLLFEVGFQLSYLAVLGIVYIHPKLYPLWCAPLASLDKAWSLLVVSFAAQVGTFPLSVYYFQQFPNFFFITNLIVIPLAVVLLYGGIVSLLFSWIPYVGTSLIWCIQWVAWLLNEATAAVGALPMAVSRGVWISAGTMVLLYVLMVALAMYYFHRVRRARWYVVGSLGLLSTVLICRKVDSHRGTELAALSVRGTTAVWVRSGMQSAVVGGWHLETDVRTLLPVLAAPSGSNPAIVSGWDDLHHTASLRAGGGVICNGKHTLLQYTDAAGGAGIERFRGRLSPNEAILVTSLTDTVHFAEVLEQIRPWMVVAGMELRPRERGWLRDIARRTGTPIHDLREKGWFYWGGKVLTHRFSVCGLRRHQ